MIHTLAMAEQLAKKRNRNNTTAFAAASTNIDNNNHSANKNMPLNDFAASATTTTTTTTTSSRPARTKLSSKLRRFVRNLSNPPSFPIPRNLSFEQPQDEQKNLNIILPINNANATVTAAGNTVLRGVDVNLNNENHTSTINVADESQQRVSSTNVLSSASALPPLSYNSSSNNGNSEINHQQRLQQRNRRRRLRHFTVINIAESIRNRLSGNGGNNNIHTVVPLSDSSLVGGSDRESTKLFNADIISDACSRLAHGSDNTVPREQRTSESNFFNIVESSKKKQQLKNYDIVSGGGVVSLPPCPSSIKATQQNSSSLRFTDGKQQKHDTLRDDEQHAASWYSGLTYSGNQSFANSSFPVNTSFSSPPSVRDNNNHNTTTSSFECDYNKKVGNNNLARSADGAETSLQDASVAPATTSAALQSGVQHQSGDGEERANSIINSDEATIVSNKQRPPSQSLVLQQAGKNSYADHIAQHFQHVIQNNTASAAPADANHPKNGDTVYFIPQYSKVPVSSYPDFVLQGAKLSPNALASSTPHLASFPLRNNKLTPIPASNFTVITKQRVHHQPHSIAELPTKQPLADQQQLPLAKRLVKRHARGAPHRQTICTSQIVVSTVKYDHHVINRRDGACAATSPFSAGAVTVTTTLPHELPGYYAERINTTRPSSSAAVSNSARTRHHFHGSTARLSNSIQHLLTALGGRGSNAAGVKHSHGKAMAFASPFYTANKVANYYNTNNDSSLADDSNEQTDSAADDELRAHMLTASGRHGTANASVRRSRNGRFPTSGSNGAEESSFIHKYLQGSVTRQTPECLYARTGEQLPVYVLRPFSRQLRACITGPEEGIANIPFLKAYCAGTKNQQQHADEYQRPTKQQPQRRNGPAWQQALSAQNDSQKQHQMSAVTRALLFANRKEASQLALEDFIALLLRDEVTSKCASKQHSAAVESQQLGLQQDERHQSDDNVSLTATAVESATTTGEEYIEPYEEKTLAEQYRLNADVSQPTSVYADSQLRKAISAVSVTHVGSAPTATIEELYENIGAATPMTSSFLHAETEMTPIAAAVDDNDKTPTNNVNKIFPSNLANSPSDAVVGLNHLSEPITGEASTPTENVMANVVSAENNSNDSTTTSRSNSSSSAVIMSAPEVPLFLHENENSSTSGSNIDSAVEKPTDEEQHTTGHVNNEISRNSSLSALAAGDEAAAAAVSTVSGNNNNNNSFSSGSNHSEADEDERGYAEKDETAAIDEEESYSSAPEMRQLATAALTESARAAAAQQLHDNKSIFQSHLPNDKVVSSTAQPPRKPAVSAVSSLPPAKPERSAQRPPRHQHNSIASSTPWNDENYHSKTSSVDVKQQQQIVPLQKKAATQITNNFMPRMTLPFPTINPEEDTPTYHWLPPPSAQKNDESTMSTKIFGISRSLYERNIHATAAPTKSTAAAGGVAQRPTTPVRSGDPVADTYAAVAMDNGGILVVADGVNWGEKARLASRCAIKGALDFLLASINSHGYYVWTTKDLFSSITLAFHAAHNLILQEHATLTTLCVAVVLPAFAGSTPDEQAQLNRTGHKQYVVCVANVGDSFGYIYSARSGVREITIGSHDVYSMRDMRDALGALGPVDEHFPELANFTCSLTFADAGDIVFLCSDGISDNFDPVVGKFCVMRETSTKTNHNGSNVEKSKNSLPTVEAYQRHELMLLRMEDLLFNGITPPGCGHDDEKCRGARHLCTSLVTFAEQMTAAKRHILEDPDLYPAGRLSRAQQRLYRRKACERLALIPGKLDHATVVAYQAGQLNVDYSHVFNTTSVPNWVPPPAPAVTVHPTMVTDDADKSALNASPPVVEANTKKLDLAKADSLMSLAIDEDRTVALRAKDEEPPQKPPPPYLAGLAQRLEELAQQRAVESDARENSPKLPSRVVHNAAAVPLRSASAVGDGVLLKNPNEDDTTIIIERNGKIVISI